MKLTFDAVQSPVFDSSDTITGTLDGKPFTVSRRLSGWTPRIMVVLDGVSVHDDTANESDKAQFDALQHRAWLDQETIRDKARHNNTKSMALLYTK